MDRDEYNAKGFDAAAGSRRSRPVLKPIIVATNEDLIGWGADTEAYEMEDQFAGSGLRRESEEESTSSSEDLSEDGSSSASVREEEEVATDIEAFET